MFGSGDVLKETKSQSTKPSRKSDPPKEKQIKQKQKEIKHGKEEDEEEEKEIKQESEEIEIIDQLNFSELDSLKEKTVRSSIIITPPSNLYGPIENIRAIHDKAFHRWMPHINL